MGVDKAARSKKWGVENAGVDKVAPCGREGQCRRQEQSAVTNAVYKIAS